MPSYPAILAPSCEGTHHLLCRATQLRPPPGLSRKNGVTVPWNRVVYIPHTTARCPSQNILYVYLHLEGSTPHSPRIPQVLPRREPMRKARERASRRVIDGSAGDRTTPPLPLMRILHSLWRFPYPRAPVLVDSAVATHESGMSRGRSTWAELTRGGTKKSNPSVLVVCPYTGSSRKPGTHIPFTERARDSFGLRSTRLYPPSRFPFRVRCMFQSRRVLHVLIARGPKRALHIPPLPAQVQQRSQVSWKFGTFALPTRGRIFELAAASTP